MKLQRRLSLVISACTAAALLLTSCSGNQSAANVASGNPQSGGTLTYSFNTDAQSLDPAMCAFGAGFASCQAVFGALMYYNVTSHEFEPGMAESLESGDGKIWTLKLRPNVTFTDGTPFDADAVAFNWQRALDPALLSPSATAAGSITWIVTDPLTVEITSNDVNYQLPLAMTETLAYIGSPTAIKNKGPDFGNAPVGAGPFTLKSWARGTEMILDRNPNFWDQPRPYVDQLVIKTIPADDQRFNALQAGEINVMAVTLEKYASRASSAGMNVVESNMMGGTGVMRSNRGALADPDVAQAIGKLIDNDQIMAAVYPDESAAETFTPKNSPLYDPDATWPENDVTAAQELIDGYRARNGGKEVSLTYTINAGSPVLTQVAELLQAQLQKVDGLNLEIVPMDFSAYTAAFSSGNFDLMLTALGGAHPDNLYKVFHTDGATNTRDYSNPAVDAALDQTHRSNDPAIVNDAYKTAIREVMNDNVYRFWRHAVTRLVSPTSVHGVTPIYQYWFRPELAWVQQ